MRRGLAGVIAIAVLAGVAAGVWHIFHARKTPVGARPAMEITRALRAGDAAGFARAESPRAFSFPADHGPHPEFKQEWWYYTGNLRAADGRHFGFQLTFFRIALAPRPAIPVSDWSTHTIYMAHFTVSDVATRRFYESERVERAALGLAGAQARPFRVWLDDWHSSGEAGTDRLTADLHAATGDVAIDLCASSSGPPILQGDRGLSRKSAQPGNASYYYSIPRLATTGTIRIGADRYEVTGLTWMDREWSTSALAPDQVGWDWFALQLSDGSDLMLYRLRRRDGSIDPYSAGAFIVGERTRPLALADMRLRATTFWRSPHTGARYPVGWVLDIPTLALHLSINPYLPDQELQGLVRYWEGAVAVTGTRAGARIDGSGYVELTGYARSP